MARIIVGIMGDALGHLNQALALAEEAPQHEYLFLGGGKAGEVEKLGYRLLDLPVPATLYAKNAVDLAATVRNASKVLLAAGPSLKPVIEKVARFSPDLAISAYEYFTPVIAKKLGVRCISFDRQHFLTKLKFEAPPAQTLSRLLFGFSLRFFFSRPRHYFISSFYGLPPRDPATTDVFPPVLRKDIKSVRPDEGDHIFVYQTSPTFEKLLPELEKTGNRFVIYGFGKRTGGKNIVFKPPGRKTLLADLSACRYAITNGGGNLISEALFLGKPVFSFPIRLAYEQFFNAHTLKRLNYGDYSLDAVPSLRTLARFEERLPEYRRSIACGDFCGNEQIAARLGEKIEEYTTGSRRPRN